MNPPPDTLHPFLKSLIDETAELPRLAASEARRFTARQAERRAQLTWAVAIAMLGMCSWESLHLRWPIPRQAGSPPKFVQQPPAPKAPRPAEFIKVQTIQEAMSQPLPTPPGASQEQKDLLEAARGLPLVLVLDESGKLARIHVVERVGPP